ncbi:uncharacterized protein LOC135811986 [Sycon ciliatum]|uniref:uncharacterized protein LOC135811986 n=1 Tax=Sycon ciliatum TaxID=27933 RepID=UPI0031F642E5
MANPVPAKRGEPQKKIAVADEAYMEMGAPGQIHQLDAPLRSPNHMRSTSSPQSMELKHSLSVGRMDSGDSVQQGHALHNRLGQSQQRILETSSDEPVVARFKLGPTQQYQNTANAYSGTPNPATLHASQTAQDRPPTPEAPYYGETPQYSVIGSSAKERRTDSVLYGNRTAERRRRKSRGSESKDAGSSGAVHGTLGFLIMLLLVILSVAALGLSIYLFVTRPSDCSCGESTNNGPTDSGNIGNSGNTLSQTDLQNLQNQVDLLSSMLMGSASRLDSLNTTVETVQTQTASTEQRLQMNEASITTLQTTSNMNTNGIAAAVSNISSLQTRTVDLNQGLNNAYSMGLLFNCTNIIRACNVVATVAGSVESCDIVNFPLAVPRGKFMIGVACEVNEAAFPYSIRSLVRHEVGQDISYSCNCRFDGPNTPVNALLICTTRLTVCSKSTA